jgi:hypothetical protein
MTAPGKSSSGSPCDNSEAETIRPPLISTYPRSQTTPGSGWTVALRRMWCDTAARLGPFGRSASTEALVT